MKRKATKITQYTDHETTILASQEDAEVFAKVLLQSEEPNEALRKAALEYEEFVKKLKG